MNADVGWKFEDFWTDPTPVTAEWVDEVWPVKDARHKECRIWVADLYRDDGLPDDRGMVKVKLTDLDGWVMLLEADGLIVQMHRGNIDGRGRLRRLCGAIGLELKEGQR